LEAVSGSLGREGRAGYRRAEVEEREDGARPSGARRDFRNIRDLIIFSVLVNSKFNISRYFPVIFCGETTRVTGAVWMEFHHLKRSKDTRLFSQKKKTRLCTKLYCLHTHILLPLNAPAIYGTNSSSYVIP
jgi:hypothetical protein